MHPDYSSSSTERKCHTENNTSTRLFLLWRSRWRVPAFSLTLGSIIWALSLTIFSLNLNVYVTADSYSTLKRSCFSLHLWLSSGLCQLNSSIVIFSDSWQRFLLAASWSVSSSAVCRLVQLHKLSLCVLLLVPFYFFLPSPRSPQHQLLPFTLKALPDLLMSSLSLLLCCQDSISLFRAAMLGQP